MGFDTILQAWDNLKQSSIDGAVDAYMQETNHIPPITKDTVLRASGLSGLCPREEIICVKKNITRKDHISAQLKKIFMMGRAYEVMYRDDVLGDLGMVIGKWRCLGCGHMEKEMGGVPRYAKPKACVKCKARSFKYIEEYKFDPSTNIGGHNDGFLYFNFDYANLEMKTTNSRRFDMVKKAGPFTEHAEQAQVYMRLHNYKKTYITYINKDTCAELGFWIDYDPKLAAYLFNKGTQIKNYWLDGTMPEKICVNSECPRAKDCAVKELCFGEFNAQ